MLPLSRCHYAKVNPIRNLFLDISRVQTVMIVPSVRGQSVEPKVTITHTDPESEGERVKGIITTDVLLTCYVLDKPDLLQVRDYG